VEVLKLEQHNRIIRQVVWSIKLTHKIIEAQLVLLNIVAHLISLKELREGEASLIIEYRMEKSILKIWILI
jgi:hypothetical protein